MVCIAGPERESPQVTFGENFSNWEFIPSATASVFIRSSTVLPGGKSLFVTVDRNDQNLLRVADVLHDSDCFTFEPDHRQSFALRHVGSSKLVVAEPRALRANRDTKGDWESFVIDVRAHADPVVVHRPAPPLPSASSSSALQNAARSATKKIAQTLSTSSPGLP